MSHHAVAGSAAIRSDYLYQMISLLWPDAGGPDDPGRVVLPSPTRPRLLVPVRPRRAAMSAVMRYTAQQDTRSRIAGTALAAAVGAGLCRALRPLRAGTPPAATAESIDDHLATVLGEPVSTALALTPQRPNRKPVLQVFDRSGQTIAFAKVGVSAYTDALVRAEAAALQALADADLTTVTVPRLLSLADWRDHPVAVQSALPRSSHHRHRTDLLDRAMVEVSSTAGGRTAAGAAEDFAQHLHGDLGRFPPDVPADAAEQWRHLAARVLSHRSLDVPFGAWHGDWTTWNCVVGRSAVCVWDWERFAGPVPRGFDRLHFVLNRAVGPRRDRYPEAAQLLVDRAGELLSPWRLSHPDAVTVAACYLLTLSARFLTTNVRQSPSGRVEEWAYPAIESVLGGSRHR